MYITLVISGYPADRYLGAWKAVLVGGAFIAAGHIGIALSEGPVGGSGIFLDLLFLSLASIIVGGAIVCGLLGETVGWAWGFGAAGAGMLLGLVCFVAARNWLAGVGTSPAPECLRGRSPIGLSREWTADRARPCVRRLVLDRALPAVRAGGLVDQHLYRPRGRPRLLRSPSWNRSSFSI
ncbi:MAG: hypothetical protein QHC65_11570 [Sphingomonas sp.]|nr:hypothetical protein [Sphingomonas sp.]MDX3885055.1 hypothetical protein [Sphingomonas sp.]